MSSKAEIRKERLAARAARLEAQKREKEEREEKERQELERQLQLEKERQEKKERDIIEMKEKVIRDKILKETCDKFDELKMKNVNEKLKKREQKEWDWFIKCEKLPLPPTVPKLNTYLYLWHHTEETGKMEYVFDKNETILNILDILEDYIDEPLNADKRKINNFKEVRESYRREMKEKMDEACFQLIQKIYKTFNKINYWESEFNKESKNIRLWMWTWQMKAFTSESTKSSSPSKIFPTISIKLPASLHQSHLILRIIYTKYDHYSDTSPSWSEPKNPYKYNLFEENIFWYNKKIEIIKENYDIYLDKEEIPYWFNKEEIPNWFNKEEDKLKDEKSEKEGLKEIKEKKEELSKIIEEKDNEFSVKKEEEESENSDNYSSSLSSSFTDSDSESYLSPSRLSQRYLLKNKSLLKKKISIESETESEEEIEEVNNSIESKNIAHLSTLKKSINEIDKKLSFNTIFTERNNFNYNNIRLRELLQNVEAKRSLENLSMSNEIRTSLTKILRKKIEKYKKKPSIYTNVIEKPPFQTLNSKIQEFKNHQLINYRKNLSIKISENEINLRKLNIIGGIYEINLINEIPLPYKHKDGTILQMQYGENILRKENFYFKYIPPVITETEDDDNNEERKQPVNLDIDKLICIDINLSDTVYWFETPIPTIWNSQKCTWSTEDIYDVRFNEDKLLLSFRIGRTSSIGIAINRYFNLPYQTWEIKPSDWKESKYIIFNLTASTVTVEYIIEGNKVRLNSLQNVTSGALDDILGKLYTPNQLIRIMKCAGLDIFPGWDSYIYVEGNSVKNKILEEHMYLCMAKFASAFQFTWSRWNLPAGRDKIVFQLRESIESNDKMMINYSMMLATTERTSIVNCTEVSPTFSDESSGNLDFHPDLNSLLTFISTEDAKRKVQDTDTDVMFTLYYMLYQTKLLSFS